MFEGENGGLLQAGAHLEGGRARFAPRVGPSWAWCGTAWCTESDAMEMQFGTIGYSGALPKAPVEKAH